MASDIAFVAIAAGFVHVATVMDARSAARGRLRHRGRIDARLAVAAFERPPLPGRRCSASPRGALRRPLPGRVRHSDRGSRYASAKHRALVEKHGLSGSMSRRGNPCDNPRAESFVKTLKVEAVHLDEYETCEDLTADLPRFVEDVHNAVCGLSRTHGVRPQTPHSSPGCLGPVQYEVHNARQPVKTAA